MKKINVFDFDKTIYDGDSTLDFYIFCLRKNPQLYKYIPSQIFAVIKYHIGCSNITQTKEKCYSFLASVSNLDELIGDFWDENIKKIKSWYYNKHQEDDVIISASPEFLLYPICQRLGISYLIASNVNPKNGKYTGTNCSEDEKVRRFREIYPNETIDEFYSDSNSDIHLAMISKSAYRVSGNNIEEWDLS